MSEQNLRLGADPEFFITRSVSMRAIPICGLLGGTKTKPIPIPGLPDGFAMQEDGVAAEFNIPPARDEDTFVNAVMAAPQQILSVLNAAAKTPKSKYVMSPNPVDLFEWQALPPNALVLGCEPDFDAYQAGAQHPVITRDRLKVPNNPTMEYRMCGFHLHLGYTSTLSYELPPFVVAQLADIWVGLGATASSHTQPVRRSLYGQAGRFRPKLYGIEYRVLDSAHLGNSYIVTEYAMWAFNLMRTLARTTPTKLHSFWSEVPWDDVKQAINTDNAAMANALRSSLLRMANRMLMKGTRE